MVKAPPSEHSEPKTPDYLRVAVRRRWSVLGPLFLGGFCAFAAAYTWPFEYRSEALILVEQQKVPEQYVTPNVVSRLQTRLDSMTQQILSRTRLQRLIEDSRLYVEERRGKPMDEVVDAMRQDISVQLVRTQARDADLTGFRISYRYRDPRTAQRITDALTSMFIEDSLRARTQQSVSTTSFLENQLLQARAELESQEQLLRRFKVQHLGELPEQQGSNLQILSSLEAQLHAATVQLDRAEQQRIYLESMRSQYEALRDASLGSARPAAPAKSGTAAAETLLTTLRQRHLELRTRYSGAHPDVIEIQKQIEALEKTRGNQSAEPPAGDEPAAAANAAGQAQLVDLDSRLKATTAEIAACRKQAAEIENRILELQRRLNRTPVREQELAEILRTHDSSRGHYQSLLQKKLESELATNLEKRQQGEQFRVLDPASLPERREGRSTLILLGWIIGLCGGVGLASLREWLDHSVHCGRDVSAVLPVHVLAEIPVLRTNGERFWRSARLVGETAMVLALAGVSVAIAVRTYQVG